MREKTRKRLHTLNECDNIFSMNTNVFYVRTSGGKWGRIMGEKSKYFVLKQRAVPSAFKSSRSEAAFKI